MSLDDDLAAVVARHLNESGREFVAACMRVAEGYFEPGDLPTLVDIDELAATLAAALDGEFDPSTRPPRSDCAPSGERRS